MKTYNFINVSFFLFLNYFLSAQNPALKWAKQIGGPNQEQGYGIDVDSIGNTYTTGFFYDIADFDPGVASYTLASTSSGFTDIFVSKLDSAGNFLWSKNFGGTGNDEGKSITIDNLGNVYVVGYFTGTADFDPGPGSILLTSSGVNDAFILKLDPLGNLIWAKQVGGNSGDAAYSIKLDGFGNICTTGSFFGTGDFDPGAGVFNLTSIDNDIFVLKLDAAGNFLWAAAMSGNNTSVGLGLDFDSFNNIYVTGAFYNTVDFDPSPATYTLTSSGGVDQFVLKLDPLGNFIWTKQMGGSLNDHGLAIVVGPSGDFYTSGSFEGTADFDPSAASYTYASVGYTDMFISKYDALGNFIWATKAGGTSFDYGQGIDLDNFGNVYTTGYFGGTADFDPGIGTYTMVAVGGNDAYILKLNSSGSFIWAGQFGGPGSGGDRGYAIKIDAFNNISTTGCFGGTADFDPSMSNNTITSMGNLDVFVHKLKQCQLPNAPLNTTNPVNQLICVGSSASLSATSSGTVNWYNSAVGGSSIGTGSVFQTPILSVGNYTYYAEAITCATSAVRTPVTLTVSLCTNITPLNGNNENVKIYPNPNSGEFTVLPAEKGIYHLVNTVGQIMETVEINTDVHRISLTKLPGGIYYFIGNSTKAKIVVVK